VDPTACLRECEIDRNPIYVTGSGRLLNHCHRITVGGVYVALRLPLSAFLFGVDNPLVPAVEARGGHGRERR